MLRLYVHRKTVRYADYGEHLCTRHGIAWSGDGDYPQGFEEGNTIAAVLAKAAPYIARGELEIVEGRPVNTTVDYNPHGLV
jgi:hypothetical protein